MRLDEKKSANISIKKAKNSHTGNAEVCILKATFFIKFFKKNKLLQLWLAIMVVESSIKH